MVVGGGRGANQYILEMSHRACVLIATEWGGGMGGVQDSSTAPPSGSVEGSECRDEVKLEIKEAVEEVGWAA